MALSINSWSLRLPLRIMRHEPIADALRLETNVKTIHKLLISHGAPDETGVELNRPIAPISTLGYS
jgi:hypothetical protein